MGVLGAKGSWPHPNLLTFGLASCYTPRRRPVAGGCAGLVVSGSRSGVGVEVGWSLLVLVSWVGVIAM